MKSNMKLPMWLPITTTVVTALLFFLETSIIHFLTVPLSIFLVSYFLIGFIKRKDALIIDSQTIKVRSPFRYREYDISKIRSVYLVDNNSTLKGVYETGDNLETIITICTNIYDVSLTDICDYLLKEFSHINIKSAE